MSFPYKVILKSGKDASVERRHPWVFSGAIKKIKDENGREAEPSEGDVVAVTNNKDKFLGAGHYAGGSIAVRLLTFEEVNDFGVEFFTTKFKRAYQLRETLGLTKNNSTNIFRFIHAEGDGLPGLIIDHYAGSLVVQAHSIGMHMAKDIIAGALKEVFGDGLRAIYYKSKETLPKEYEVEDHYLYQAKTEKGQAIEYDCQYDIDWVKGQKTGFFVDQRENRKLIADYSKGKNVLNTFCYSGGFSIAALKAGANLVHSVDSSAKAIDLTDINVKLNNVEERHESFVSDTFKFFEHQASENYDIIILDPPAFAKHVRVKHNAVQGYKRLNATALRFIQPGGILFTFSCSQVVDQKLFYNTVMAAAIQVGREVKVLHHLTQPADHPVSIFHPEGEYLKGLVVQVW
jgi:23S rRNA (cytosine1962-C5)-methyltransferase